MSSFFFVLKFIITVFLQKKSRKTHFDTLFLGGDNFADFSNQSPNFVRPPTQSNRGQQGQTQTQHPQPRGGNQHPKIIKKT